MPATLAARVRLLGSGCGSKNDPNDALSTAIAALRDPHLRTVLVEDHAMVLRLLADRHQDLTSLRTQAVCRLGQSVAVLCAAGADQDSQPGVPRGHAPGPRCRAEPHSGSARGPELPEGRAPRSRVLAEQARRWDITLGCSPSDASQRARIHQAPKANDTKIATSSAHMAVVFTDRVLISTSLIRHL